MAGKSLAQYAAEARRDPFTLDIGGGQPLVIQPPTVDGLMAIYDAPTDRDALAIIAGDQFAALWAAVKDQPAAMLGALLSDMRKHFGLGN